MAGGIRWAQVLKLLGYWPPLVYGFAVFSLFFIAATATVLIGAIAIVILR
jgi:hypothetical protein